MSPANIPSSTALRSILLIRVVSRNVARRRKPLADLRNMDADIALLQEVGQGVLAPCRHPWRWVAGGTGTLIRGLLVILTVKTKRGATAGRRWSGYRTEWKSSGSIRPVRRTSRMRTRSLSATLAFSPPPRVIPKDPKDCEPFIVASMYAHWNATDGAAKSGRSIADDCPP